MGKRTQQLIVTLGVVGLSFSAVLVRWSTAPSMVLAAYRTLMAAALLTVAVWRHRGEIRSARKADLALSLVSGLFFGLHLSTYFESLRYTSIASSVVLVDTEVFFVALGGGVLLRQRIAPKAWAGIALAFAGSAVVALSDAGGGENLLLGDALALGGALFMAVYTMLGAVCRRRLSTTVYTWLVYLGASATVLALLGLQGTALTGYPPVNLLTALGMAVFCTLLGHSVFSWGLRYLPASFISTVKLLEPVFACLWGAVLFGEIPGPAVLLGGTVVIVGIGICTRFLDGGQEAPESKEVHGV